MTLMMKECQPGLFFLISLPQNKTFLRTSVGLAEPEAERALCKVAG